MRKKLILTVLVLVLIIAIYQGLAVRRPLGYKEEVCNMSVDFTAAGDGIDFGNIPAIDDLAQKTIMAWVNAQSYGHDGPGSVIISAGVNVDDGWAFDVNNIGGGVGINTLYFREMFSGGNADWTPANGSFSTGSWIHVAVTYDNSHVDNDPIFYINGVLSPTTETTAPSGTVVSNSGSKVIIGNRDLIGASFNLTFDGDIVDARIYGSILPANIIADIAAKRSFRLFAPFPLWRCKMIGASGLQTYEGAALAGGNKLIDDINGVLGTPVSSPTGHEDTILAYQG